MSSDEASNNIHTYLLSDYVSGGKKSGRLQSSFAGVGSFKLWHISIYSSKSWLLNAVKLCSKVAEQVLRK